jgi:hypothetical protein
MKSMTTPAEAGDPSGVTLLVTIPGGAGDRCEPALRHALDGRPCRVRRVASAEGTIALEIHFDTWDADGIEVVAGSLRDAAAPPATTLEIETGKVSTQIRLGELLGE